MNSQRMCCVPSCRKKSGDNIILHKFPHPQKDSERFRSWVFAVGGNILALDDMYVYRFRKVCHLHFEPCYFFGKKFLSNIATPTLHIKGPAVKKYPLKDITNINSVASPSIETCMPVRASTSNQVSMADETSISLKICGPIVKSYPSKHITKKENSVASPSAETCTPARASPSNDVSMTDETSTSLKIWGPIVKTYPSKHITKKENLVAPPSVETCMPARASPSKEVAMADETSTSLKTLGPVVKKYPTKHITNKGNSTAAPFIETSMPARASTSGEASMTAEASTSLKAHDLTMPSKKKNNIYREQILPLQREIKKLVASNTKYVDRLKNALILSKNKTFQEALKKFTTLAALFTVMQFREFPKNKMGRRFTDDEKVMALSIYKRGPRAYRILAKIFVLPSPVTLSRMISRAGLKPGINDNIFCHLKKRAKSMKPDHRLCVLIFDEMALSPHFDYNIKKDGISGFVADGVNVKNQIADHVLVFMIRGILKHYKQPIGYTFCHGSTKKEDLKILIKNNIEKLSQSGFQVLATVCDQGTSNVSAINLLIEETRISNLKNNKEVRDPVFEVDGCQVIPLYDVPHLLKGIRNNLLQKDLRFIMDGTVKVAKWDHIMNLYENNPTYKGIRMIKKLSESHCTKEKIPKMKVKYATQIFSQTVGVNMGYLADQGVLSEASKDTADLILFIDNLFDSFNGSSNNCAKRSGKTLLNAVTPKSPHEEVWNKSKTILQSMQFLNKDGRTSSVPTTRNWLLTVNNVQLLVKKLSEDYNIKSLWCRHLNQDPLENFFGCIRSHGCRNNNPSCAGFEAAFAALLVNNLSSYYSPGSNCEDDACYNFKSLKGIFFTQNSVVNNNNIEIDYNHLINEDIIEDFEIKKRDPRIITAVQYVTGYILKKLKEIVFKKCKICTENFYDTTSEAAKYLKYREFDKKKSHLTYPSDQIIKCFSSIQDIINFIMKENPSMPDIKNYIKLILYARVDVDFIKCDEHKKNVIEEMYNLSCTFFLCNWCRDINKILCGTSKSFDCNHVMQSQAIRYASIRRKRN